MSNSSADNISGVKNMKIGILADKKNPDGYIIPQEIIKEYNLNDDNQVIEYDDYTSMLVDLYANEIQAMFVTNSYETLFSSIEGYEKANFRHCSFDIRCVVPYSLLEY